MAVNLEPLRSGDPPGVGRYRFLGRLGAGGMGLVCLGRSPEGRLVAVKLIHEDIAAVPDYRRRFAREVSAASRVIGRFTAALVDADPDAAQPWYAAEYIEGPTLKQVVRSSGPLEERSLRALAGGLADAVAAIAAAGLVHRDLKPDNILLAADGPKVIDFGIARADNDSLLTHAGSVLGSPGYMSPEQVAGDRAETPSDVFSLGAVLTFAAQGTGPFGDGPAPSRMYLTRYGDPDCSGVPQGIRPLVLRCLARAPRDRPLVGELVRWWSVDPGELDTLIHAPERMPTSVAGVVLPEPEPQSEQSLESQPQPEPLERAPEPRALEAEPPLFEPKPTRPVAEVERRSAAVDLGATQPASASDLGLGQDAESEEPWRPPEPRLEPSRPPTPSAPRRYGTSTPTESEPPISKPDAPPTPSASAASAVPTETPILPAVPIAPPSQLLAVPTEAPDQPPPAEPAPPSLWLPGADQPSVVLPPASPPGLLDSRLPTVAAAELVPRPVERSPFEAREWTGSVPVQPVRGAVGPGAEVWWHQPVLADLLPGGRVRDAVAVLGALGALAAFRLSGGGAGTGTGTAASTALHIANIAVALLIGLTLGLRRGGLAVVAYGAAALAGVPLLPGGAKASAHDPTLGYLLQTATLLLFAAAVARLGGAGRRPVLGFAVAFAGYIAGVAVATAWAAHLVPGIPFLTLWQRTEGVGAVYRDAGISAACAVGAAFAGTRLAVRRGRSGA